MIFLKLFNLLIYIKDDYYRAIGVPSLRMSLAQVFVNDIYWGIFTLAEQTDRVWVESQYPFFPFFCPYFIIFLLF